MMKLTIMKRDKFNLIFDYIDNMCKSFNAIKMIAKSACIINERTHRKYKITQEKTP